MVDKWLVLSVLLVLAAIVALVLMPPDQFGELISHSSGFGFPKPD